MILLLLCKIGFSKQDKIICNIFVGTESEASAWASQVVGQLRHVYVYNNSGTKKL